MEGRVKSHNGKGCLLLSNLLFMLAPPAWCEGSSKQSKILPVYSTTFSQDVAIIDRFNHGREFKETHPESAPDLSWRSRPGISEEKVGSFVYSVFNNPKKIAGQAAAAATFVGLEALGAAAPLKESMKFLKDNTQFKFGKCSKVKFSSQLKAESCLMENSKIELNSDYKLDSVTVKFNWSM